MKKIILMILLIVTSNYLNVYAQKETSGADQPEFYMPLTDSQGAYYRILATHYGNEPVYDNNYDNATAYNSQWEMHDANNNPVEHWISPGSEAPPIGFDGVYDNSAGTGGRGILGYGLYKIEIQRKEGSIYNIIFTFYIDTRQDGANDEYYNLDYDAQTQTMTARAGIPDNLYKLSFNNGDLIERWVLHDIVKDWTSFTQNIPVTNDVNGTVNYSLKTELLEKTEGFPVEESNYPVGYQFDANEQVPFWKEATYKFEALTEMIDNYKVRNWNYRGIYGKTGDVKLEKDDYAVKAIYQPTHPLTVNNYLEGGSGGSYQVEWIAASKSETLGSNQIYNAFDNGAKGDEYNIQIDPTIPSTYGTVIPLKVKR